MNATFEAALTFVHYYRPIHLPLVTTLCCFGTISHILVFNSYNMLMISLSICQLILLQSYVFFTYNDFFAEKRCNSNMWQFGWVLALLLSIYINVVVHSTAVYHVIVMSIVRYFTIRLYSKRLRSNWFTINKAFTILLVIYVTVPVLCIPVYLSSTVEPNLNRSWCAVHHQNLSFVPYRIDVSELATNRAYFKFNFWWYAMVCKLIPCPCVFLMFMTILLTVGLRTLKHQSWNVKRTKSRNKKYTRTTYMTLAVMALFVVVELPQSLLNLAAGIGGDRYMIYYSQINDLFEMLTVLYSSVNFIILCLMSGQFRTAFMQLFRSNVDKYSQMVLERKQTISISLRRASQSFSLFLSEGSLFVPPSGRISAQSRTPTSRQSLDGTEMLRTLIVTGNRSKSVTIPATLVEESSQTLL